MFKMNIIILVLLHLTAPVVSLAIIRNFHFPPVMTGERTVKDLKKFVEKIEKERHGKVSPELSGQYYCTYPGPCRILAFKLADTLKKNGFDCRVQVHRSSMEGVHYFIVCETKEGNQIVDPTYRQFKEYLDPSPGPSDPKIFVGTLKEMERLYGKKPVLIYKQPQRAPESDRPPRINGASYPW